jgi:hypothetical protein
VKYPKITSFSPSVKFSQYLWPHWHRYIDDTVYNIFQCNTEMPLISVNFFDFTSTSDGVQETGGKKQPKWIMVWSLANKDEWQNDLFPSAKFFNGL